MKDIARYWPEVAFEYDYNARTDQFIFGRDVKGEYSDHQLILVRHLLD